MMTAALAEVRESSNGLGRYLMVVRLPVDHLQAKQACWVGYTAPWFACGGLGSRAASQQIQPALWCLNWLSLVKLPNKAENLLLIRDHCLEGRVPTHFSVASWGSM